MNIYVIGDIFMYVAGIILVFSFMPQIYTVYKNKSTRDIPYLYLLSQLIANSLIIAYGVIYKSIPILCTNISILFLLSILSGQKVYYSFFNNLYEPVSEEEILLKFERV